MLFAAIGTMTTVLRCCVLAVLSVAAATAAASRSVSWYMPRAAAETTLGWLNAGAAAAAAPASASSTPAARPIATGVYLCCNGFGFGDDGTFTSPPTATIVSEVAGLVSAGLTVHYVLPISNISVATGSWKAGLAPAVSAAVAGGFHGYIVDYEPDTNYTHAHAVAYGAFLKAFASALHAGHGATSGAATAAGQGDASSGSGSGSDGQAAPTLQLGFDSAGWGILHAWDVYSTSGVDISTSMQPTYSYTGDGTPQRAFIQGQLADGMRASVMGAGIGTMLARGYTPEWNYNWTEPTLSDFAAWLSGPGVGVHRMDFWRADIDHHLPPNATAPWVFDVAATFLQGGGRT